MMSSEQEETITTITTPAITQNGDNDKAIHNNSHNNNNSNGHDGDQHQTNNSNEAGTTTTTAPTVDTVGVAAVPPVAAAATTTDTANETATAGTEESPSRAATGTGAGNDDSRTPTSSSTAKKSKKKVGSKKGGRRVDRPQSYWYRLCLLFDRGEYKSQIQFLRSPDSGDDVGEAQRMHFSRAYKKYQNGTLGNCEETRARKRKYEPLEQRVIQYWQEQQQLFEQQQQDEDDKEDDEEAAAHVAEQQQQPLLFDPYNPTAADPQQQQQQHQDYGMAATTAAPNDNPTTTSLPRKRARNSSNSSSKTKKGKPPLAWSILQAKAKEWAQELGLDDGFQASAGWIDNVLKRHQRESLAQQTRASLDATLAQRRTQAQYSQKMSVWVQRLHRSQQWAVLQDKAFQWGDRVTVLDVSQKVGDLVVARLNTTNVAAEDSSDPASTNHNNVDDPTAETTLTVERKRHGTVERFSLADARKVIKHLPQEEDTPTLQQLLLPQNQDPVLAHLAHFSTKKPKASRVLRPIWEFPQPDEGSATAATKATTSMRLEYSDTSCPEKINIQVLKNTILPMFRKDQKERQKLLDDLKGRSSRTKVQQETLEKLQYAQLTHDMAKDLYAMVKNMPARGRMVVYQVDYEALDAAMRGRWMAHNPAPFEDETNNHGEKKSYAPRTLTLQAMPSDLRTALVSSFAHWITTMGGPDILQLRIFCSLAHICHAADLIPSWLDYQLHSTDWCDYIQNVHAGISPAQAKLLPHILMQGGTYETWKQAMDEQTAIALPNASDESWTNLQTWVMRLSTEWRALRDIVLGLPQFAWTEIDRNAMLANHKKAPAAIPNVLMVRVLQACERDIWTLVEHTFVNQGWKIRAKLMEGVLVEGPTSVDPVGPVLAAAQHACHMRGWNMILVEGHCFGAYPGRGNNHKDALPLLQEAREAMEQLQQQQQQSTNSNQNNNNNNTDIITAGNITINGGTVNVSVNANDTNPDNSTAPTMDLDPTTGTGDMTIFGQDMALT